MADTSNLRRRFSGAGASSPAPTATTTALPNALSSSSPSKIDGTMQSSPVMRAKTGGGSSVVQTCDFNIDEFSGTVAATFLASKGTELLNFVCHKVQQRQVATKIIESEDSEFNILLMSLPYSRMLVVAEELGLRKRDLDGYIRTFRMDDVHLFTSSAQADALFTQSEQILLLEYSLNAIKPDKKSFDDVIGNESILEWCKRQHYVDDVFPLHHRPTAAAILADLSWKSPLFDVGGISKVQDYFGDKVALYFAFLVFYTKALFIYGCGGLVVFAISSIFNRAEPYMLFLYSIFATLWGAAFVSLWKRRNTEIVFMWTSLIMGDSADESLMSMTKKEDLRRQFFGVEVSHRITGEKIMVFPKKERIPRLVLSVVVVLASLFVSTRMMLAALDFEDTMHNWIRDEAPKYKWASSFVMKDLVLGNLPLVVYMACLTFLDLAYNYVARRLTEHENHKYNAEFENNLVFKLVLFQFLNMNMAYLHVAFIRRDYVRLSSSIRTVLMVELFVGNIKKIVVPMFLARRKRKARLAEALAKKKRQNPDMEDDELEVTVKDLNPITLQLDMDKYEGVFEDYFEKIRQFSQISLFAAAFPLGGVLAFFNNLIEVYTDAHKLVSMTRRASPQRALNIGAWIRAFEFISIIGVMTNLGIITVTASFADSVVGKGVSKVEEYFWMIVIEHVLVVARFAFATLFEGIPSWVRDQRAKERFAASKKASDVSPTISPDEPQPDAKSSGDDIIAPQPNGQVPVLANVENSTTAVST